MSMKSKTRKPKKVNGRWGKNKIPRIMYNTHEQFTHIRLLSQQSNLNAGIQFCKIRYQEIPPQYTHGAIQM